MRAVNVVRGLSVAFVLWMAPRPARAAGALETVVEEAVKSLGAPAASVVVAAPLASDEEAPKGDELALRVAALLAGTIGAGARAHPQAVQLATARAVAGRASALVYVQTAIAKGDVRITVDVFRSIANAWDRIRNPLPSPTSHAFASGKIDAEVRAFLVPLVLEQATVHRARHEEGDVLAAACGDVDGDGGDDLVLVSRARVAVGRIRAGRFTADRAVPWSALARRVPVPLREPLAAAVVRPGEVDVGSTDRGGVSLTSTLQEPTPLAGLPAWGGEGLVCLTPQPAAGAFDGAPIDCAIRRDARPVMAVPAPRFDAFAAAGVREASGALRPVVVVREPSGRLRIKLGDAQRSPDGTVGAQLAVGDLDQDGAPEVATTVDGADDAINVTTWPAAPADPRTRLHIVAPAGVRALAFCPPEQDGQPVLVAVVGNEVWLVRAGLQGAAAPPAPLSASSVAPSRPADAKKGAQPP